MMPGQLIKYLQRIHLPEPMQASVGYLFQLQKQHLMEVPFENLDIHLHRSIKLNVEDFYKKIVLNKRGGFCYELNGLFADLLNTIGFLTSLVSCRPYNSSAKSFGEEFDHMAIVVLSENTKWLVDVGFGDFSLVPLKIEMNVEQSDGESLFRIIDFNDTYLVQRKEKNDWENEYLFSQLPRRLEEFASMCHYHQTSPQSHFTKTRVCSRVTTEGRITLSNTKLKLTRNRIITETEVRDEEEFINYLKVYFDIEI